MPLKRMVVICIMLLQQLITQAQVDKSTQQKPSKVHIEFSNALAIRRNNFQIPDSLIKKNRVKKIIQEDADTLKFNSNTKIFYDYDKDGKLITSSTFFYKKSKESFIIDSLIYDTENKIIYKITTASNDTVVSIMKSSYKKIKLEYVYDSLDYLKQIFYVDDTSRVLQKDFFFSEQEKSISINFYDKNNYVYCKDKIFYDDHYEPIKWAALYYQNRAIEDKDYVNFTNIYNTKNQLQTCFSNLDNSTIKLTGLSNYLYYTNGLLKLVIMNTNFFSYKFSYEYY